MICLLSTIHSKSFVEQQPWARQQTRRHPRLLCAQTARVQSMGHACFELNSIKLYRICNIQYFICESRLITTLLNCWKSHPLHTAEGNTKWYQHYGKHYGDSSRKSKMELKYYPLIPPLGVDQRSKIRILKKSISTLIFYSTLHSS